MKTTFIHKRSAGEEFTSRNGLGIKSYQSARWEFNQRLTRNTLNYFKVHSAVFVHLTVHISSIYGLLTLSAKSVKHAHSKLNVALSTNGFKSGTRTSLASPAWSVEQVCLPSKRLQRLSNKEDLETKLRRELWHEARLGYQLESCVQINDINLVTPPAINLPQIGST